MHQGEHGAEERAVRDEEIQRERAGGETAGERDDRDAHVVDDDERAHEWPVSLGDVRPEATLREMLASVRRQRGRRYLGQQETDREGREERDRECRERDRGESRVRADARWKLLQDESPKAAATRRRFAVYEGMPRGDEIVQALGRRVQREVAAGDGEVAARAP